MAEFAKEVIKVNIEDELKQSYLDYSMSVIVGRALPDVRDGLKPVHRRVLYAMHVLGNSWNKAYKKSARVVGDVIGKYHPHGDTSVYDAIVRMAQPFSMRYVLVDGQGNFGSVDGDSPAAMRYTEIRMSKITHNLLADLEKDTVDFVPNYDETELQPWVLPTRVPNLLVNGSSGIAVGMATNIPPHNLSEVINGSLAIIENPGITIEELMKHIPGPDFPTAAYINGRAGIVEAYRTGRGKIYLRAKTEIETNDNGKSRILIHELPYQVNKARLIEKIADLVKEKKIEGISGLRDESDKKGMRVVIEIKRTESAEVVLNKLYTLTQLQTVFGINMVALVDCQPKVLNLKEILFCFINHRKQVISRRTNFELQKARNRAHILEGLGISLANIDKVISLIKESKNPAVAKSNLLEKPWEMGLVQSMLEKSDADICKPMDIPKQYGMHDGLYKLTPTQAQAILDLKLHKLTGLEQEKIINEFKDIIGIIKGLIDILENPEKLMEVIKTELREVKEEFGDERKTEILSSQLDLSIEDLISEEDVVVTISHNGYIKIQPVSDYQAQKRGGRGKSAMQVKDEDYITNLTIANTHDTILCFSSHGKVYSIKTYQLPLASRNSKGKPIINILPLQAGEKISAMLKIVDNEDNHSKFIFMATMQGVVKKVELDKFTKVRATGIIAVDLAPNDSLVGVEIVNDDTDVMLVSNTGKAICFHSKDVRPMGRNARGVKGIKLQDSQVVISLIALKEEGSIFTASENGYGKRTKSSEFPRINRGGQGVIAIQSTPRNGNIVSAVQVLDDDDVILITDQGTLVRIPVEGISLIGRNTQGVTLINLQKEEKLVDVQRVS